MSHKTGKRVLATTATSALAFAGLIAMPLASHAAAADVSFTDACGFGDTMTITPDTGVYEFRSNTGSLLAHIDSTESGSLGSTASHIGTVSISGGNAVWNDPKTTTWVGTNDGAGKINFAAATSDPTTELASPSGTYYVPFAKYGSYYLKDSVLYTDAAAATKWAPSYFVGLSTANNAAPVSEVRFNGTDTLTFVSADGDVVVTAADTANPVEPTASNTALGLWDGADATDTTNVAPVQVAQISLTSGMGAGWHVDGASAASTTMTRTYAVTSGSAGSFTTDANGKIVYSIPTSFYDFNKAGYPLDDIRLFSGGTNITSTLTAAALDGANCDVESVPPVASDAEAKTFTVTKGTGLDWFVTTAATLNADDQVAFKSGAPLTSSFTTMSSATTQQIEFDPAAGAGTTATFQVTDADGSMLVTVEARPAAGNTGSPVNTPLRFDGAQQVTYVAPVKNDLDGTASDGVTVQPINGVTWYYTYDQSADVSNFTTLTPATGAVTVAAGKGWTALSTSDGETVIPRGSLKADGTVPDTLRVAAVAQANNKFSATSTDRVKVSAYTFQDTTEVTSIPAPTFTEGAGSEDYYTLPAVPGIDWVITGDPAYPGGRTVRSTELGLLNTPIRVISSPAGKFTVSIAATQDATHTVKTGVSQGPWTHEFDSRTAVTPTGPQFLDATGLADDKVTFPNLGAGLTKYQYALTAEGAAPGGADWKDVDGAWYGRSVALLADMKAVSPDTQVHVQAVLTTGNVLATNADGKPVKGQWTYFFDNKVNISPEPPVMNDQPGTANDTLTFPLDSRVIYTTIANGVSKTLSVSDLGKPLPYTGRVVVKVAPAAGYAIQTNPDGTKPADWVFTFGSTTDVIPASPQSHDRDGTDQDTYVVPNQPGVLWTVDGVDLDPTQYGKEISTGGKSQIRFVARAASGYTLASGAETEFFLHWNPQAPTGEVTIDHTILDNGYQADVEWSGPEDAEGVTYTVEFAKVTQDEDGDEVLGTLQTWKEDTEETGGRFSAGYGVTYKIYVTATDEHGTESDTVSEYISFPEDSRGTESRWTDINRSTVTPSGNDALGWYQVGSSLYFNNTAFVTYRDQSNITFTVNGGQQLRVYGTQYTKGGRALIQVNGTNWAWLDAGASSNADPYKKMLRQINLPNTGTHTIKIIASLLPGKELALDAYEVVK